MYGKIFTVNKFFGMGVPKRTVYDIIRQVNSGLSLKRKVGSGLKCTKIKKLKKKSLIKRVDGMTGVLKRRIAE